MTENIQILRTTKSNFSESHISFPYYQMYFPQHIWIPHQISFQKMYNLYYILYTYYKIITNFYNVITKMQKMQISNRN